MHSIKRIEILKPDRVENEIVDFELCENNKICTSDEGFKSLIRNRINTESYIKQLERLLDTLAEPVEAN